MDSTTPMAPRILDAAAEIVIGDGVDALGYGTLAERLGVSRDTVRAAFPVFEQLIESFLGRMTASLAHVVVDNVGRDPRGGLPSRIYGYAVSAIYEAPLARALYFTDPAGLVRLMRAADGVSTMPDLSIHPTLLPRLQEVGMARPDIDPTAIASVIRAVGSGISMSAPGQDLGNIATGLTLLLERTVDADVVDTMPGKEVLYACAGAIMGEEAASWSGDLDLH